MALIFDKSNWRDGEAEYDELKQVVTNVLVPSLNERNIKRVFLVRTGNNYFPPTTKPNEFKIIIGAKAHERRENERTLIPGVMWGEKTDMCERCGYLYEPSGDGLIIIEPGSGYAVAEIIENCLYFLFDVCNRQHLRRDTRISLLSKILREAIVYLGKPFPSIQEMLAGKFEIRNIDTLKLLFEDLVPLRRRLMGYIKNADALSDRILKLNKESDSSLMLKKILEIPEIEKVSVNDGTLTIYTHIMYASHPLTKELYEFGKFRIRLSFGESANAVFHNLDRHPYEDERGFYGHPHVERGGNHWCMGEGKGLIGLLSDFEVEAGIVFALKAIESVNESRDGNYLEVLESFPKVKKRTEYPKKEPTTVNVKMIDELSRIIDRDNDNSKASMERDLEKLHQNIAKDRNNVFCGTFYSRIHDLCQGALGEWEKKVSAYIQSQIDSLKKMPQIKDVVVEKNVIIILLTDKSKLKQIKLDYEAGLFECTAKNNKDHTLPIGQLLLTVTELYGGLDFETATLMILGSLDKK